MEKIIISIISLVIGLITFYILSSPSHKQKRENIEEILSQLINFIIFIWIGKIVFHFSGFISDPIAVLAYPSDSSAFYFAVIMMSLLIFYKSRRNQINVVTFFYHFTTIFIVASFVYEFIQIFWNNNHSSLAYVLLLGILNIILIITYERLLQRKYLMLMFIVWSFGVLLIAWINSYIVIFGYIIHFWFVGLFCIVCLILLYKDRRRWVAK